MPCRSTLFVCLLAAMAPAFAAAPASDPVVPPALAKDGVTLQDIRTFTSVYNLVKQAYVEDKSDKQLMDAAIKGLLSGLDPHSEYLDPRELNELSEDTSGAYEGLGVEVFNAEGVLRVIAPIDDTPAERAGIKAGDVITRIDGKTITADNANQATEDLRGKPGSEITLTVLHEGTSVPVDMTMKRETIRVSSVKARWIEPGYAWLRVAQFQEDSGAEVKRKLAKLREKVTAPLRGVVLDLRSNPGGLLTSAVEVSDAFLDSGVIVTTKGRLKESVLSFSATAGDISNGASMVVLVDKGTASAAEIVSGALKDNHRALIMGQKTFGKGSVQTVLPLEDGHAVKLTTARYFTPSGTSIQATGIVPDIALRDLKLSVREAAPSLYTSERDLPNHLKGDNETEATPAVKSDAPQDANDDYALSEAVHVLKAMALRTPTPSAEKKG